MSQTPLASEPPRSPALRQIAPWLVGIAACAGLGVLYFATRVEIHTFDALSYAWNVRDKAFALLYHPHHLLYAPLGKLAVDLAHALGYTGLVDVPIQAVNALAGALGIFFLWRFGARWTGRPWPALSVAVLVGLCYAYWLYAAEVEVYTLATAFLALSLWLIAILADNPRPFTAALLGAAHAGAIMFHQTNALFALPVLAFLLVNPRLRRLPILAAYAITGTLLVVGPYTAVGLSSGFKSVGEFYHWFMGYAETGIWGGHLNLQGLLAVKSGWQDVVSPSPWLAGLFYLIGLTGLVLGIVHAVRHPSRRAWVAFGGVWLLVYGIFFWWWEPWNVEFWIATLPLWGFWMLAAWPPPADAAEAAPFVLNRRAVLPILYGLLPAVLAGFLFGAHLGPIRMLGDRNNDYYYRVTEALAQVAGPDDLVVTRGNVLDLYLPFYIHHDVRLSLRELTQQTGGDRASLMGQLIGQLDWAMNTGQVVLVDAFVLDEPQDASRNPFGLLPEEIATIRDRYPLAPAVTLDGATVFYSTPRYDDPQATAWDFTTDLQGWLAYGVNAPHFEADGWCFSGGSDPQLKGPLITLDAGVYTRLSIDLTVDAGSSEMEVYWRTPDGDYSLDDSTRVETHAGRATYTLDLAGEPGWQGTIGEIRIDPIPGDPEGSAAPVSACVHSVTLEASP